MNRRQFLATTGLGAVGTSTLLGTGACSTVASDRHASIAVATDPHASLRLSPIDTPNSDIYATIDGNGHFAITVGENPNGGQGDNSNSITVFDGRFEICNGGIGDGQRLRRTGRERPRRPVSPGRISV